MLYDMNHFNYPFMICLNWAFTNPHQDTGNQFKMYYIHNTNMLKTLKN
jgi:hypothetical protein